MRRLSIFLLVSTLALPAEAQQPVTREEVIAALSGFESQPTVAELRGWGAVAPALLTGVVDDADVMVAARARAAYALRVFIADPAALTTLRRLAESSDTNLFVRLAAIDALAESGAAMPTVTAQLASPDADVRAGAAGALSRAPDVSVARAALSGRLRVERDAAVRTRLDQSLRRISTRAR